VLLLVVLLVERVEEGVAVRTALFASFASGVRGVFERFVLTLLLLLLVAVLLSL